jgi:hypothetical protein
MFLVLAEVIGTDDEIAQASILGHWHGDGQGCPVLRAVQSDEVPYGREVHDILSEVGGDCRIESGGAVSIEKYAVREVDAGGSRLSTRCWKVLSTPGS